MQGKGAGKKEARLRLGPGFLRAPDGKVAVFALRGWSAIRHFQACCTLA